MTHLDGQVRATRDDAVAVEEPLEIRVGGRSVAVVMRTPGHDRELAAGFLVTESVVRQRAEILDMTYCPSEGGEPAENVLDVLLAPEAEVDWSRLTRNVFTSSSCGICSKATIDAVRAQFPPIAVPLPLSHGAIAAMPGRLRAAQAAFALTGGLHASALCDASGRIAVVREDVGRHNALDKVIGHAFFAEQLPLAQSALLVSGRVSFEIVQKALAAGIPAVVALSAPTSAAVELARASGANPRRFRARRAHERLCGHFAGMSLSHFDSMTLDRPDFLRAPLSKPLSPGASSGKLICRGGTDERAQSGLRGQGFFPQALMVSVSLAAVLLAPGVASAGEAPEAPAEAAATPANETAPAEPSPAEIALQELVGRQQELMNAALKDHIDEDNFRRNAQRLANDYEDYLKKHPNYAPAYAAYGVYLGRVDMNRQAAAMLLKANELFGKSAKDGGANTPAFVRTWALVKNQLGNHLAEEGKPLQAVNYYLAAIELTPNEPLYHYQLGTLLTEARDAFIASGYWTRESLDRAMHDGFRRAAELAPERLEFRYRYAESFYDLEKPDWNAALKIWGELEESASSDLERQTMRLHAANILIKTEKMEHARGLLAMIDEPTLEMQKQKLMVQLPPEPVRK